VCVCVCVCEVFEIQLQTGMHAKSSSGRKVRDVMRRSDVICYVLRTYFDYI